MYIRLQLDWPLAHQFTASLTSLQRRYIFF